MNWYGQHCSRLSPDISVLPKKDFSSPFRSFVLFVTSSAVLYMHAPYLARLEGIYVDCIVKEDLWDGLMGLLVTEWFESNVLVS
jgi:hypothetical protein